MTLFINALNSLTPLGLAGLLGVVIYLQVRNQTKVKTITENHLHGLPEMAESLRRIETTLKDINDHVIYLRARVNGKS